LRRHRHDRSPAERNLLLTVGALQAG
jgi:hypothetical protein